MASGKWMLPFITSVVLVLAFFSSPSGCVQRVERQPRLPISNYQLLITLCRNSTVSDVTIFIARGERGSSGVNLTDPSNWQVDFSNAKLKPCRVVVRASKGYAFKFEGVRFF